MQLRRLWKKDSINFDVAFWANRYDKKTGRHPELVSGSHKRTTNAT